MRLTCFLSQLESPKAIVFHGAIDNEKLFDCQTNVLSQCQRPKNVARQKVHSFVGLDFTRIYMKIAQPQAIVGNGSLRLALNIDSYKQTSRVFSLTMALVS